jgi:hypothetical protein
MGAAEETAVRESALFHRLFLRNNATAKSDQAKHCRAAGVSGISQLDSFIDRTSKVVRPVALTLENP